MIAISFERVLNQYLRLDPETTARLAALHGKVIAMELSGLNRRLYLLPASNGIRIVEDYTGDPDVVIRGTPLALSVMLSRLVRGSKVLNAEVEVYGDTHVAKAFQDVFSDVDIDWEEHLSRLVGDPAAHQLGNIVRSSLSWGWRATDTLFRNTAEYLQQETRDLPPRMVVESFLDAVDELRIDTDRLEARILRLQKGEVRNDS